MLKPHPFPLPAPLPPTATENDGISGSLISEMTNLEYLRFFILEQGSTAGRIPTEYGLFDNLLIFDMDFNDLTGPIPEELFDMNVLQQ